MGRVVQVEIVKCTFAKTLNYFLSLQLNQGEKLRTEVAEVSDKPEFNNRTFRLKEESGDEEKAYGVEDELIVRIGGYVIFKKDGDESGKPSLLGTGTIDLKPLMAQLEGGKFVLCDDVPLKRKSKKKGHEHEDITVGKLQARVQYSDSVGSEADEKEEALHPDSHVCNITIHSANVGQDVLSEIKSTDKVFVESRVVTRDAHQAMLAFREDSSQKGLLEKFWPKVLGVSQAATRSDRAFHWNEVIVLRIEPRAIEEGKAIRLDIVPGENNEDFQSLGGVTLSLDALERFRQYNLNLNFLNDFSMESSIEIFPSFNEDMALFKENEKCRRVQIQLGNFVRELPYEVVDPYVRIAADPNDESTGGSFYHCKELVNPVQPGNGQPKLRESTAGLKNYPSASVTSKLSERCYGTSDSPRWTSILEFNVEKEEEFKDFVQLEFYHDGGKLFGKGRVDMKDCTRDGNVNAFSDVMIEIEPKPKSEDEGDRAAEPEEKEVKEGDNEDYGETPRKTKRKKVPFEVKVKVWSAQHFVKHLESSLDDNTYSLKADLGSTESVPSSAREEDGEGTGSEDSGSARRLDPEEELEKERKIKELQDKVEALEARRETVRSPPSPALTPGPSRDSTPAPDYAPPPSVDVPLVSPSRAASQAEHARLEEKVVSLEERIGILTADLSNKQTLIDRLISEVDKRSEAIRNCGFEIVELRKANSVLCQERDSAFQRLRETEEGHFQEAYKLSHPEEVDRIDPANTPEMKRRIALLGKKYMFERQRNEEIIERIQVLQKSANQTREIVEEHKKLEHAHKAQSRYIQELQEETARMGIYKATIKTQEKVILKLEDLLESKLRTGGNGHASEYEEEIQRLQDRNHELEENLLNGDFIGDSTLQERIKELEAQLENGSGLNDGAAQEKIQALEDQLVENAKAFANDIAQARMKIFEYEAIEDAQGDDDMF